MSHTSVCHYTTDKDKRDGISEEDKQLIGDPQTSGGLLFSVDPSKVDALVDALEERES